MIRSLSCILISRFGKVFRANRSAEPYFREGLSLTGSELSCTLPADTSALRRIVSSLCGEIDLRLLRMPRSLVVQRPSGRPFVVQAVQLSGMVSEVFSPARVLLFIVDPFADRSKAASAEELQRLFGLTQAEAALLSKLQGDISLATGRKRKPAMDRDRGESTVATANGAAACIGRNGPPGWPKKPPSITG